MHEQVHPTRATSTGPPHAYPHQTGAAPCKQIHGEVVWTSAGLRTKQNGGRVVANGSPARRGALPTLLPPPPNFRHTKQTHWRPKILIGQLYESGERAILGEVRVSSPLFELGK